MPPVLGPSSLSKIGLWSCEDGRGKTVFPSVNAIKEASSPVKYS
jgi:hypothetical protein